MDLSRRDMFRGLADPTIWPSLRRRIPLPYTEDPGALRAACLTCRPAPQTQPPPCQAACAEDIIRIDRDGAPFLDLSRRGCIFCGDCAGACPPRVLDTALGRRIAAGIVLDPGTCLAWSQTMCQACADRCPELAIRFSGLLKPTVDRERCTRCGLCVGACPAGSIEISV